MHPTAHPNDIFVHTHHWSMLPETVALIQILAKTPRHSSDLPTVNDISDALDLAEYWTHHPDERLALWITFHRASNMTDDRSANLMPPEPLTDKMAGTRTLGMRQET